MILPRYSIRPSAIPGAGKGLFLEEIVRQGSVLIAPDKINGPTTTMMHACELAKFPPDSLECQSSIRWFEQWSTVCLGWDDECFVNHSFDPNGLWHLGFVFAQRDIEPGEELTMDYRFIVGDHEKLPFRDAHTGKPIVGLPWNELIRHTARQLLNILPEERR